MNQDTNIVYHPVYDTVIPQLLLRPVDSTTLSTPDSNDYLLLCNDSIFAPYAADSVTLFRPSMFANSHTSHFGNEPQLRDVSQGFDWMFFVIIAMLALVSINLNRLRFNLKDIFASLFNQHTQGRVERENNVKTSSLLSMTFIYLASVAAVATRIATSQLDVILTIPEPLFFAILTGILFLYVILRGGLIRLIGSIFNDIYPVQAYLTSNHFFFFVGALILPPLLLFVFFAEPIEQTALAIATAIIAIILIVRLARGLQLILTNSKTSKLYLFYYLCTLEIVPILVMVKILTY